MAKRREEKEFEQSVEKLPPPWFGAGHGIDNHEDAVRLDEVQAIKSGFGLLKNDKWDVQCKILLRGGHTFEMHLSPKGYDELLRRLGTITKIQR